MSDPRVRLRDGFSVIPMRDGVQLRAGDEEVLVVRCRDLERALRTLDELRGNGLTPDTMAAAPSSLDTALLRQLNELGLLESTDGRSRDESARYWSHFGQATTDDQAPAVVSIEGHSSCVSVCREVLEQHAIEVASLQEDGPELDLILAVVDRPDVSLLQRINAVAVKRRLPCLFADLSHGPHATLGPFYIPGEGACYECYRRRWIRNSASSEELEAAHDLMIDKQSPLESFGTLPGHRYQVAGMLAGEVGAYFRAHRPLRLLNRIATLSFEKMTIDQEPCWQLPWCTSCGSSAANSQSDETGRPTSGEASPAETS